MKFFCWVFVVAHRVLSCGIQAPELAVAHEFSWPLACGILGLPRWCSGKESTCQYKRHRRLSFNPWVSKTPWSRKWQSIPDCHFLENSMDRGVWRATVQTQQLRTHTYTHTHTHIHTRGILAPWPVVEPASPALEGRFLMTGHQESPWKNKVDFRFGYLSLRCLWYTLVYTSNKHYVCNSGVWNKNLSSIYLYMVVEVMGKIA